MFNGTSQNWLQHASYVENFVCLYAPWHDMVTPNFDLHIAILTDFECSCSPNLKEHTSPFFMESLTLTGTSPGIHLSWTNTWPYGWTVSSRSETLYFIETWSKLNSSHIRRQTRWTLQFEKTMGFNMVFAMFFLALSIIFLPSSSHVFFLPWMSLTLTNCVESSKVLHWISDVDWNPSWQRNKELLLLIRLLLLLT